MTDDGPTQAQERHLTALDLASRNTGLAVQRTRMSADRTLMSVVRTALALVSFGFTIGQVLQDFSRSRGIPGDIAAGTRFGIALVSVGILMLTFGILYHLQFMLALRRDRTQLIRSGAIRGESPFPVSLVLITAIGLLGISIVVILGMVFHVGPFWSGSSL